MFSTQISSSSVGQQTRVYGVWLCARVCVRRTSSKTARDRSTPNSNTTRSAWKRKPSSSCNGFERDPKSPRSISTTFCFVFFSVLRINRLGRSSERSFWISDSGAARYQGTIFERKAWFVDEISKPTCTALPSGPHPIESICELIMRVRLFGSRFIIYLDCSRDGIVGVKLKKKKKKHGKNRVRGTHPTTDTTGVSLARVRTSPLTWRNVIICRVGRTKNAGVRRIFPRRAIFGRGRTILSKKKTLKFPSRGRLSPDPSERVREFANQRHV